MQPVDVYSYPRGRIRISPDRRQPAWQPHGSSERELCLAFSRWKVPLPFETCFPRRIREFYPCLYGLGERGGQATQWVAERSGISWNGGIRLAKEGILCNALPARHSRFNVTRHIPPSNSRTGDAAVLVVGLISGGTVNLSHVASHFHGPASVASNDRRRRRFFQFTSSTRTGWRVRWWRGSTYARPCGCALTAPIGSKDIRFASRSEAICIVVT